LTSNYRGVTQVRNGSGDKFNPTTGFVDGRLFPGGIDRLNLDNKLAIRRNVVVLAKFSPGHFRLPVLKSMKLSLFIFI